MSTRTLRLAVLVALGVAVAERAAAVFTPIAQPGATYVAGTSVLPITASDFDVVSSLTNGTDTVSFDVTMVALTVPTTWSSWGSAPDTEGATPRVLWTNGFTSLTLTLSGAVMLFGFEAQPNTTVVSAITATFFNGISMVGQVVRDVDGNGGALLFAASSTTAFDRVVVSSVDDFAIAQVRSGAIAPTATPTVTQTATVTRTATATPTSAPGGVGGMCTSTADCTGGLFCADGVCCTSPCSGPQESCRVPPNVGVCTTLAAPAPAMSHLGLVISLAALLLVGAAALLGRAAGRRP